MTQGWVNKTSESFSSGGHYACFAKYFILSQSIFGVTPSNILQNLKSSIQSTENLTSKKIILPVNCFL